MSLKRSLKQSKKRKQSFINEEHVKAGPIISFVAALSKRTPIGVSHSRTKFAEVGHFGLLKPRTKPFGLLPA
jgi:hypothetical protein